MAVNILALLAGMVIYAYFSDCNPIQMKRIAKTDEYFPFFVVHYLSKFPGIAGLHVSSVYAGSLSTISSGHDLIMREDLMMISYAFRLQQPPLRSLKPYQLFNF